MAKREALKLNDTEIRQWVKNNIRFDARADGNGLYLRHRETDKKPVFFFRFKYAGIENKIIIGKFSDMSLASARKECVGFRNDINKGINPADVKREKKLEAAAKAIAEKSASTVRELVDDFFKRNIDGKCKTARAIRQRVDNYLIPAIGKMKIEDVKPMHISHMLDACVDAGAPTTANDILSLTKRIFNHAIKRHTIIHNPAAAFDISDAGGEELPRERFLSEAEIIQLLKAMSASERFTRHHY
jgi:hypothetical protein